MNMTPESMLRDHLRTARESISDAYSLLIVAEFFRKTKQTTVAGWYSERAARKAWEAIRQLQRIPQPAKKPNLGTIGAHQYGTSQPRKSTSSVRQPQKPRTGSLFDGGRSSL